MLTLENDNKLIELRKQLENEEMTTQKVSNEDRLDTNRVNKLIGNYHNNKSNNYTNKNNKTIHNTFEKKDMYRNNTQIDLNNIEWGEVLYVNLDGGRWSEQNNDRFAVCIQNEIGNKYSPTVIVAFVTSQQTKSKLPTHVEIPAGQFGLPKDSIVMLEQVRTLDKRRIKSRVGVLDEITKQKVKIAKDISMNELEEKTPLEKLPKYKQDEINETLQYIYSYEKVLGRSKTNNLEHLLSEREMLLNHLERMCLENGLDYKDYYKTYTKSREVAIV